MYEVMLLDENNQPLHEIGLAYIAKGANQASFSFHWQQLLNEVTKCHAIANGIPARQKDIRFNSLCVFQFNVKRELAGNNAKSPACKVDSHVSPTQANWEQFFLGRQNDVADRFLDLLAPNPVLSLPQGRLDDTPEDEEVKGELVVAGSDRAQLLEDLFNLADQKGVTPAALEEMFSNWFFTSISRATAGNIQYAIAQLN